MTDPLPSLADLRRRIDSLDDQLHALLKERTAVVEQVRAIKLQSGEASDTQYMRPAREAAILRRLVQAHTGPFPRNSLTRIWREIISSLTLMQGPLAVAVYAPGDQTGLWDVARDHFGVEVPLTPARSAMAVLRTLSEGGANVGVLPWPEAEEDAPWWPSLVTGDKTAFNIVGVLPFAGAGNARSKLRSGMRVASLALDATGDDRTLVALHLTEGVSRDRLTQVLTKAGAEPTNFLGSVEIVPKEERLHLVELAGFLEADGPTLTKLQREFGDICLRLDAIGAYATPMGEEHDVGAPRAQIA